MEHIAQRLVSMTVVGVPGAGKGMFVSNLLRLVRQHHPQLHIFVMEGKGDQKEAGYWQGVADDIRSIQGLDESPINVVAWINGCLEDFKAISGPKLLIFDEVTYLYKVWQTTEKEGFEDYIQYKIGLSSMGDSLQNYIWEIGQVSNAKDLGRDRRHPLAVQAHRDSQQPRPASSERTAGHKICSTARRGKESRSINVRSLNLWSRGLRLRKRLLATDAAATEPVRLRPRHALILTRVTSAGIRPTVRHQSRPRTPLHRRSPRTKPSRQPLRPNCRTD